MTKEVYDAVVEWYRSVRLAVESITFSRACAGGDDFGFPQLLADAIAVLSDAQRIEISMNGLLDDRCAYMTTSGRVLGRTSEVNAMSDRFHILGTDVNNVLMKVCSGAAVIMRGIFGRGDIINGAVHVRRYLIGATASLTRCTTVMLSLCEYFVLTGWVKPLAVTELGNESTH